LEVIVRYADCTYSSTIRDITLTEEKTFDLQKIAQPPYGLPRNTSELSNPETPAHKKQSSILSSNCNWFSDNQCFCKNKKEVFNKSDLILAFLDVAV